MNEIGPSEKGRGGKEGGIDGRLDDKWKKGNSSLRRKKRGGEEEEEDRKKNGVEG